MTRHRLIWPFTAILTIALSAGCGPTQHHDVAGARVESNPPKTGDFMLKANAIKPGTRMDVVRKELGNPDEVRHGTVEARPEPGPAETLTELTPAGTRYEQWTYKRGDSHFHVFFTRPNGAEWQVLTVRSTPSKAVE